LTKSQYSEVIEAQKIIPKPIDIIDEAFKKIPANKLDPKYVEKHFSELMLLVEKTAHNLYINYQNKAWKKLIDLCLKNYNIKTQKKILLKTATNMIKKSAPIIADFEFRLGQGRKQRGGGAVEEILMRLLAIIKIDSEKPYGSKERKKLNKMDLISPNQNIALTKPSKAKFLTCKRTLRERWKQTVPEMKKGWKMYLITLETNLSKDKADDIKKMNLIAYVPDELKKQSHLKNKSWIRKLSELPNAIRK